MCTEYSNRWLHGKARWPVDKQACFTKFCPHSLGGSAKKTMFLFHGTFPSRRGVDYRYFQKIL